MALYFLDTSALVKRYLAETGSDWLQTLSDEESIAISALALPELASVFARRIREQTLTIDQRADILATFAEDTEKWLVVDVSSDLISRAAQLIGQAPASVPLRALDGLQLASATVANTLARRQRIALGAFVSADHRLLAAAQYG